RDLQRSVCCACVVPLSVCIRCLGIGSGCSGAPGAVQRLLGLYLLPLLAVTALQVCPSNRPLMPANAAGDSIRHSCEPVHSSPSSPASICPQYGSASVCCGWRWAVEEATSAGGFSHIRYFRYRSASRI